MRAGDLLQAEQFAVGAKAGPEDVQSGRPRCCISAAQPCGERLNDIGVGKVPADNACGRIGGGQQDHAEGILRPFVPVQRRNGALAERLRGRRKGAAQFSRHFRPQRAAGLLWSRNNAAPAQTTRRLRRQCRARRWRYSRAAQTDSALRVISGRGSAPRRACGVAEKVLRRQSWRFTYPTACGTSSMYTVVYKTLEET